MERRIEALVDRGVNGAPIEQIGNDQASAFRDSRAMTPIQVVEHGDLVAAGQ